MFPDFHRDSIFIDDHYELYAGPVALGCVWHWEKQLMFYIITILSQFIAYIIKIY